MDAPPLRLRDAGWYRLAFNLAAARLNVVAELRQADEIVDEEFFPVLVQTNGGVVGLETPVEKAEEESRIVAEAAASHIEHLLKHVEAAGPRRLQKPMPPRTLLVFL